MMNTISDDQTPCGICKKSIYKNRSCILCSSCQLWIHLSCNELNKNDMKELDHENFVCIACLQTRKAVFWDKRKLPKKSVELKHKDNVENTPSKETMKNMKVEEESGSDGSDFEDFEKFSGKLSEVEMVRLENIKRNREMFEEYNITGAKEELAPKRRKSEIEVFGLKIKKEKIDWESLPRRKSLRLQNQPAKPVSAIQTESKRNTFFRLLENEENRKPDVMEMKCVNILEENFDLAVKLKSWYADNEDSEVYTDTDNISDDIIEYKEKLSSLRISGIARVTKERGYSLEWYPSRTKKIICSGDKRGCIGIWDVENSKEKDSVLVFDVHSRPVTCLTFSPFDSSKLYSCSYDGTFTCGDFNQMKFSRLCTIEETYFNHFSIPYQQRNTVLLSSGNGELVTFDLSSKKIVQEFILNKDKKRTAKCVDSHPLNENLIATSSGDGMLALWDLRNIRSNEASKCLSSFQAPKTIVKTFFSPNNGNKLLMTSQDDHLRVFDVDDSGILQLPPRYSIRHENYYGRWLTTFRATWDPKNENTFVCGSMANPRQVDLFSFDDNEKKLLQYNVHDENFAYITSLNVFHPHFDIIGSCNSTGKVLIWSNDIQEEKD